MDTFVDKFDVALRSKGLFCDLVITLKEARNNISYIAIEILKKPDGIAEKQSEVKPVSYYAKIYELVRDKTKYLDTQSEDNQGSTWTVHATCYRNFNNTKKLETNSKQKINETGEVSKIAKVLIILIMTGPTQKNRHQFQGEVAEETSFTVPTWSVKKINYSILNTFQQIL